MMIITQKSGPICVLISNNVLIDRYWVGLAAGEGGKFTLQSSKPSFVLLMATPVYERMATETVASVRHTVCSAILLDDWLVINEVDLNTCRRRYRAVLLGRHFRE